MLGGDLNPHFFHWPSLTFYLFAAVFAVVSGIRKLLLDDPVLTRDVAVLTGRLIVAAAARSQSSLSAGWRGGCGIRAPPWPRHSSWPLPSSTCATRTLR